MRVMYVASEATPFIKSGGLADVIGSLPKETAKKDVESIVVIPKYQAMKFVDQIEYVTNFDIYMGWRKRYCGIFKAEVDGVTFYFIDNEQYFGRPGLYGYDDDYERFAYVKGKTADILKGNDKQVAYYDEQDSLLGRTLSCVVTLTQDDSQAQPYTFMIQLQGTIKVVDSNG